MPIDLNPFSGPSIAAVGLWQPGNPSGVRHQLLSNEERSQLARISSIARFKKGDIIYKIGEKTEAAFNVISGVVAIYAFSSEGRDHITAFVYPKDIFGLSAEGEYSGSARAATDVMAYRIPIDGVHRLMAQDAALDLAVISKLCEGLREAQHHAFLLSRAGAASKIAMFIALQEHLQSERDETHDEIHLPMDRTAIANFCGLTLSAVSRAFRELVGGKMISFRDRRHLKVMNRGAFEKLANGLARI